MLRPPEVQDSEPIYIRDKSPSDSSGIFLLLMIKVMHGCCIFCGVTLLDDEKQVCALHAAQVGSGEFIMTQVPVKNPPTSGQVKFVDVARLINLDFVAVPFSILYFNPFLT
mmetsp:Transcript_49763/g.130888  ORF Transcript_49763/g.130888 Transcript_49763/m.130888 type:complete len:111 (-) Transcript_49763:25-357(-)